ncbi:hypothetical protein [Bradyrhizobium iriomotense]|uniref:Transposase n=1 Tax=Bradyrhizobium iriomotense TaxID=441950 RepID=A0ABQ6B9Q3_9BRAD|nr:hypothetical protein [Bradyrhizobium iriomotense]GLR91124.1 hypothetical protein GCM10007857_78400 [Bradyrhizobium iriomotense]
MRKKQIIASLKEDQFGVSVADLCRKRGVSDASTDKPKADAYSKAAARREQGA